MTNTLQKVLPTIGDEIVVNEIGSQVRGYVTGFGKKDGSRTVEYQPGERPAAGVLGEKWCRFEDVLEIVPRKLVSKQEIDTLRMQGYSVDPSKSQAGRFRWWRETGSDGVSVPKRELSETTFTTEADAWDAAKRDSDKLFGQELGTEYYVWCDDDCQNKTGSLEEAKKWRDAFIADGRASWIIDSDNNYITDGEVEVLEQPRG
jgi:hypothetical protein